MKYRNVLPSHKFYQECSFYIFPSKLKITQFPLRCAAPHACANSIRSSVIRTWWKKNKLSEILSRRSKMRRSTVAY